MRSRFGFRQTSQMVLLASVCLLARPSVGRADPLPDDLQQLRVTLRQQIESLKREQQKLYREVLRLDQKSELLDRQLRGMRATGLGPGTASQPENTATDNPATSASGPGDTSTIAQASTPSSTSGGATSGAPNPSSEGESAPISGPSAREQQARRVLETAPTLSSTGGVLTPKGQIVIDPSFEYDYSSQNQLGVNGFQIIPGIAFGNFFVNRVEQNIGAAAVTVRTGITNRFEVNVKIPYVINYGTTTSLIPEGATAQLLTANASNHALGDIQFGASYQINSGQGGWPIFVGNLLFKTATGVSPFDVPIITLNDPNGQFLQGIPKRLATGTGFYSVEPSVTVLYPTAPGVLFANLLYLKNIGRTVNIQSTEGGPSTPANLTPGQGLALTFGIGFSLNDSTSLTLSYQQEHIFTAYDNGAPITGSPYSFGTFNFGLGYEISRNLRLNISVGVGAGPNTPAAKVLVELPYRFNM